MDITSGIRWKCENQEELPKIAGELLVEAASHRVFTLHGDMGAGKTTLIKALCLHLGVREMVASPTFNIVNEYLSSTGDPVYHFDFYRIKSESEAFDLGYENYLYSGNYCFIEWPEKIVSLLPDNHAKVVIEPQGETRVITLCI
jgi:tRNA threonylcarbamoyladenosine biosynthesis protein TsaE